MTFIITGDESDFPGFASVKFDLSKALSTLYWFTSHGYSYCYDGKAEDITAMPPVCRNYSKHGDPIVKGIDCSGFHRYVMYRATGGLIMKDGSDQQREWYTRQGFKHHVISVAGSEYTADMDKTVLYACFCRTGARGESVGHVWYAFYQNGNWWTCESHDPVGPSSRLALTSLLAHIVTDTFPIARIA